MGPYTTGSVEKELGRVYRVGGHPQTSVCWLLSQNEFNKIGRLHYVVYMSNSIVIILNLKQAFCTHLKLC